MSAPRAELASARRWVVKVGSALLTANGRGLDAAVIGGLLIIVVGIVAIPVFRHVILPYYKIHLFLKFL